MKKELCFPILTAWYFKGLQGKCGSQRVYTKNRAAKLRIS